MNEIESFNIISVKIDDEVWPMYMKTTFELDGHYSTATTCVVNKTYDLTKVQKLHRLDRGTALKRLAHLAGLV